VIKKLDLLIIKAFIGPFIVTFFVSLFVLVMQFFWLYMDELLGKGFGAWTIMQLLFFMSSTMVPLALPLGILLASIMTFGGMGENFELVAIKSSGISLLRFMRPLFLCMCFVALGAFFFNNNIIPVANLKAFSLLYDLRNARMSLNIRAGQFNKDIPGYAIKVGSKDQDERTIRDIIIYEGGSYGNDRIVLAKSGVMEPTPDGKYLLFQLRDGWRYQEGSERDGNDGSGHATQTRMHFVSYDKIIDLSALRLNRHNEDLFKGGYQMMDAWQLRKDMALIRTTKRQDLNNSEANFAPYIPVYSHLDVGVGFRKRLDSLREKPLAKPLQTGFALIPDSVRNRTIDVASANLRNAIQLSGYTANNVKLQNENLIKREISFHQKFTLSFACILLYLIGAPLGAIIRKGGLGMPILVAIIFFIVYFVLSNTGKELVESRTLVPWLGMWMSTLILMPIAAWIIVKARNDSTIFSKEWYSRNFGFLSVVLIPFKRLSARFRKPRPA
jgi:lipopolysaccharide export system permease protein